MTNHSFGKCRSSLLVVLALLTFVSQPLFAQAIATRETPQSLVREANPTLQVVQGVCGPPPDEPGNVRPKVITIVPLKADERLLYKLGDLTAGTLELRYRVDGRAIVTESIDLTRIELPLRMDKSGAPAKIAAVALRQKGQPEAGLPEPQQMPRVIELLALQPNTTRELHRRAREGAAVDVDVVHDGVLVETIPFADLLGRSVELRNAPMLPVFAPSEVGGSGVVPHTRKLRVATEYYESCMECQPSDPCDTECGWDPNKGREETCGEYGMDCTPSCGSSWYYDFWGDWTFYASGTSGTACLQDSQYGSTQYYRRYTEYKREKIRRTTTCPNSPSCDGCYTTDSVIDVQYSISYCYENSGFLCFNGDVPCCSLCNTSYFWSYCSNSFPCYSF